MVVFGFIISAFLLLGMTDKCIDQSRQIEKLEHNQQVACKHHPKVK